MRRLMNKVCGLQEGEERYGEGVGLGVLLAFGTHRARLDFVEAVEADRFGAARHHRGVLRVIHDRAHLYTHADRAQALRLLVRRLENGPEIRRPNPHELVWSPARLALQWPRPGS